MSCDVGDIEKTLMMLRISKSGGCYVYSTPEPYEDFVRNNPEYNLNGITFVYGRISLNDDYVINVMKTYFHDFNNPVPYQILKYLMSNQHLYKNFKHCSYIPEDEKSLELFGSLNIRSTEKTAAFCQKWCSVHGTYFDMRHAPYQTLLKYDRVTIEKGYVMCHTSAEIKTAVSVLDRAPDLLICVPTLSLLEILEKKIMLRDEVKKRLKMAGYDYQMMKYIQNETRKERTNKRMFLSRNIDYWGVQASHDYYHELNETAIYNINTHYCIHAAMYLSYFTDKTSFNASIQHLSIRDLNYMKLQKINVGKEHYWHLLV